MQTITSDFFAVDSSTQVRYQIACPKTRPAQGSVLLLQGRGDCLEHYSEVTRELTGRGFSVYAFDWRGQGLSTRPLADRLASHVSSFEDYLNDLHQFVTRIWQPDTRHRFILGQSMGAHLALRYLAEHDLDVSGALLCAPMIGVKTRRWSTALAPIIMEGMAGLGLTEACIPGNRAYRPSERKFEDNPLTSDERRFHLRADTVRQIPDLEVDGPTFGWMDAAFRSAAILNAEGYVEGITTRVVILVGDSDVVVDLESVRAMAKRLCNCHFMILEGAKHEVMMETDTVRALFWQAFDRTVEPQA